MNGSFVPMLGTRIAWAAGHNADVKNSTPSLVLRPSRGFTLIEVMVALIVLVLGVLGAAAMTLTAIRDSKQSGLRSQASALAYEMGDLMRANTVSQEGVFTGGAPVAVATCWTTGCTPAEMANNDFYEWRAKLTASATGLPNGNAVICRDAAKLDQFPACDGLPASPLVVKLQWDEKNNNARGAAAPTAVTTRTMAIPIQPY